MAFKLKPHELYFKTTTEQVPGKRSQSIKITKKIKTNISKQKGMETRFNKSSLCLEQQTCKNYRKITQNETN